MDVLLLGAAAIVLLALTIWIVWRPSTGDAATGTEEATRMMPQGDEFEDQYTSATADLSAGGVAVTTAGSTEPVSTNPAQPESSFRTEEGDGPWPQDSLTTEGSATGFEPIRRMPADEVSRLPAAPQTLGIGAAALLTLGGAISGAWLYARWQRERNKPLNRLRRRFR
jgi:hypothetical protein